MSKWAVAFATRLIKKALSNSPKNREQLLKITKLPERALRYNLSKLKEQKLVKEMSMLRDLRRKIFLLNKEERKKLGWPNPVRQSAAVGLLIKDEKLRPTHAGSNPAPSSFKIRSEENGN